MDEMEDAEGDLNKMSHTDTCKGGLKNLKGMLRNIYLY